MTDEKYQEREMERSFRLCQFAKGELLNMYVEARMKFALEMFIWLTPEIMELKRQGKIKEPYNETA